MRIGKWEEFGKRKLMEENRIKVVTADHVI
jgi:hypothetical protein